MTHSLLAELGDDQAELVALLGRPWTVGDLADTRGWPVWDFVERTYRRRRGSSSAAEVIATLPTITIGARAYGLWWRSDGPRGLSLQPGERVGLSIVGLHHLWPQMRGRDGAINAAAVCLEILREASGREQELDADLDWTTVKKGQYDLRTERFGSKDGSPVELLGQTLQREFIPLAMSTSQFNYVVEYGAGRLAALQHVKTIQEYVDVAEELAQVQTPQPVSSSPIQLSVALDYLGLVLENEARWDTPKPVLRIASLADAATLSVSPSTQAEFDRNVSVLWNILQRLQTPRASEAAYKCRKWEQATSGSINNLDIWLADVLHVEDEIRTSLATIRALGRIRQGAQHSSGKTQLIRDDALIRFGLSWPLTDFARAWQQIADACSISIYGIAQAIRRA